jgi:hypothetical protein
MNKVDIQDVLVAVKEWTPLPNVTSSVKDVIDISSVGKGDGECFGMLIVPFKYFKK